MINPTDPAFPTETHAILDGFTKRELIAKDFMAAYLSSSKFDFTELYQYAQKAIHATDVFIDEFNKTKPFP